MVTLGYVLSSEEHSPSALVDLAADAESAGFEIGLISDHYMPWVEKQGESSFVWAVVGAIAQVTRRMRIGTGVTCPIFRTHPAIVAQAAATAASLLPGRFFLGVGTGEKLNEHILGQPWPRAAVRRDMLEEAVDIMRRLWRGHLVNYNGTYFCVDEARIYSLPEMPPPIYMAAAGTTSAERAGLIADGLISSSNQPAVVEAFRNTGNEGPRVARMSVCYAPSESEALRTARAYWPNGALHGRFMLDVSLPRDFETVAGYVSDDQIAESIVCGPDPEKHAARIQSYVNAGFDQVCIHQVGKQQDAFFRFYSREIFPRFEEEGAIYKPVTHRRRTMAKVDSTIQVEVPVQTAYNQWTQFEEFPMFMEGVREVRQIGDDRIYWNAEVGGENKEWYARITQQIPDTIIAWQSEGGVQNDGSVVFKRLDPDHTEIELHMEFEPESMKEEVGSAMGVVSRRVEGDLKRFKDFIESRGRETGAWRGEIGDGEPGRATGSGEPPR